MNSPLNLPRPSHKTDEPKLVSAKDDIPTPSQAEHNLSRAAPGRNVQLQFQVPPEIRRAVRSHAADNDLNMSELFLRMWDAYKSSNL